MAFSRGVAGPHVEGGGGWSASGVLCEPLSPAGTLWEMGQKLSPVSLERPCSLVAPRQGDTSHQSPRLSELDLPHAESDACLSSCYSCSTLLFVSKSIQVYL